MSHVEPAPKQRRFDVVGAALAGVWTLLLVIPAETVLTSDDSVAKKALFLFHTALFAAIYTAGFGFLEHWKSTGRRKVTGAWITLTLFLIAGHWFYLGIETVFYITWVVALLAFSLPLKASLPLNLALVAAAAGAYLSARPEAGVMSALFLLLGPAVVTVIAVVSDHSERASSLERRLLVVEERERIARDVHDVLGHSLTLINLKAELIHRLIDTDPEAAKQAASEVATASRTALAEARQTVTRIQAPDFSGEIRAARRAFDTAGITATLPEPELAHQVAGVNAQLFSWVLKEAVTNIVRHSGASRCEVTVTPERLEVRDNGTGVPGSLPEGGGLAGLSERVESAGGTLTLQSNDPRGTRVIVSMTGKG